MSRFFMVHCVDTFHRRNLILQVHMSVEQFWHYSIHLKQVLLVKYACIWMQ